MPTFAASFAANKAKDAAVVAFRESLAPGAFVTVRDVGGVYKITNSTEQSGWWWCTKQRHGQNFGPGRMFPASRMYPVPA